MKELFSGDEWGLLVKLPRWVVRAASAAQPDTAARTHVELNQGFLAVTDGTKLGSSLVSAIVDEAKRVFDEDQIDAEIDFSSGEPALSEVIVKAQSAVALVAAKAPADAAAYRAWLLAISDVVVAAAKTGGVAGLGGVQVTLAEVSFDRRLETALA